MQLKDCNLQQVITCAPNDTITNVAKLLRQHRTRTIFVVENGKPVGVISATDIINRIVAEGHDPDKVTAEHVMNTPVFSKDVNDTTADAYILMAKENIFLLAVCENGKLKGAVGMHQLLKHIVENAKPAAAHRTSKAKPVKAAKHTKSNKAAPKKAMNKAAPKRSAKKARKAPTKSRKKR